MVSEIVQLASLVALDKALDEAPHFAGGSRVAFLADVDEVIAHLAIEAKDELRVLLLPLLRLLLRQAAHLDRPRPSGSSARGRWEERRRLGLLDGLLGGLLGLALGLSFAFCFSF